MFGRASLMCIPLHYQVKQTRGRALRLCASLTSNEPEQHTHTMETTPQSTTSVLSTLRHLSACSSAANHGFCHAFSSWQNETLVGQMMLVFLFLLLFFHWKTERCYQKNTSFVHSWVKMFLFFYYLFILFYGRL